MTPAGRKVWTARPAFPWQARRTAELRFWPSAVGCGRRAGPALARSAAQRSGGTRPPAEARPPLHLARQLQGASAGGPKQAGLLGLRPAFPSDPGDLAGALQEDRLTRLGGVLERGEGPQEDV
eukprot:15249113-Alexandrium_andersonii.AAC.1